MSDILLLSLVIFAPTIGALFLAFCDKKAEEPMRMIALAVTLVTFFLTIQLYGRFNGEAGFLTQTASIKLETARAEFEAAVGHVPTDEELAMHMNLASDEFEALQSEASEEVRHVFGTLNWIPQWNIKYTLGVDGISMPLVLLTSFTSLLAMGASWSIKKQVKGYLILFLLLETGMLGVFLALDFFLFYVFWEVMLLPMYFLIGVWGGPRKEYAAIKFFLYTLAGSVLMLIAMLMFYFDSGRIFDLLHLSAIAKQAEGLNPNRQVIAFTLLFIGFAIKLPAFPFHTWLPDAHVEAPTPISMILAGVLLKMGGYGIIRIAFPLCPYGAQVAALVLVGIGAVSIIYGAFAALAQTDFKRMVAYSSVSHMGYVLIGMAVWAVSEKDGSLLGGDYWLMGMNGAMFQMLAHGVSSAGMFFMVGVIYDRVHHRDLNKFGGLASKMPLYTGLAAGIFFAGLGLPGLCGFIGEVFVVLSAWNYNRLLAIIAAAGVILTAGYILWAIQRVFLGAEYKGPHAEDIVPMNGREISIAIAVLVFAVLLGVYPMCMLGMMEPTLADLTQELQQGYENTLDLIPAAESAVTEK